jgi:hypothetical protein
MFDPELFAAVAKEIEEEDEVESIKRSQTRSPRKPDRKSKKISPQKPHLSLDRGDEEAGWQVHDAPLDRVPAGVGPSRRIFNFAAHQADAKQIDFDSQSIGRRSASITPRIRQVSHFSARFGVGSTAGLSPRSMNTPVQKATSNHLPRVSIAGAVSAREAFKKRPTSSPGSLTTPNLDHLRRERQQSGRSSEDPDIPPVRSQLEGQLGAGQEFIPQPGIFSEDEEDVTQSSDLEGSEGGMDIHDLMPDTQQLGGMFGVDPMERPASENEPRTPRQMDVADFMPDTLQRGGEKELTLGKEVPLFDLGLGGALGLEKEAEETQTIEVAAIPAAVETESESESPADVQEDGRVEQQKLDEPIADIDESVLPDELAATREDVTRDVIELVEHHHAVLDHKEPVLPTSQRTYISSRQCESGGKDDFAPPDPQEDEEDRRLLHERSSVTPRALRKLPGWRIATADPVELVIKSSPRSPPMLTVPRSLPRVIKNGSHEADEFDPPALRAGPRPVTRLREQPSIYEIDPYLVDADGEVLRPDSTYVLPRNHSVHRSLLHGQLEGQTSCYSRISGRHKWSKTEEILLYRTVQKVPMSQEYPLRVVWYLHGEHGVLSRDLEMFNPQHMKDKMRVIVTARVNNGREVVGRARYWLPSGHPDKMAYLDEVREERERERKRIRKELEKEEAGLKSDLEDEDELDEDGDEGNKAEVDGPMPRFSSPELDELNENQVHEEGEDELESVRRVTSRPGFDCADMAKEPEPPRPSKAKRSKTKTRPPPAPFGSFEAPVKRGRGLSRKHPLEANAAGDAPAKRARAPPRGKTNRTASTRPTQPKPTLELAPPARSKRHPRAAVGKSAAVSTPTDSKNRAPHHAPMNVRGRSRSTPVVEILVRRKRAPMVKARESGLDRGTGANGEAEEVGDDEGDEDDEDIADVSPLLEYTEFDGLERRDEEDEQTQRGVAGCGADEREMGEEMDEEDEEGEDDSLVRREVLKRKVLGLGTSSRFLSVTSHTS